MSKWSQQLQAARVLSKRTLRKPKICGRSTKISTSHALRLPIYCTTNTHLPMLIYRVPRHALPNKTTVSSNALRSFGDKEQEVLSVNQRGAVTPALTCRSSRRRLRVIRQSIGHAKQMHIIWPELSCVKPTSTHNGHQDDAPWNTEECKCLIRLRQ